MTRAGRLALLSLLAGCDKLFDLRAIPTAAEDARADTTAADGPLIDVCVSNEFDEDGDGIGDNCDLCPTITSTTANSDGDGLPDACDLDLSLSGDKLLFAATFASGDLTQFVVSGLASPGGSQLVLGDNSRISTVQAFLPTLIEIRVDGIGGGSTSVTTDVSAGGATCHLIGAACSDLDANKLCLDLDGSGVTSLFDRSLARVMTLSRRDDMICRVSTDTTSAEVLGNGVFADDNVTISTSGTTATITSIVIYGAL